MDTYARIADLPLTVDGYALEGLVRTVSSGFERVSTVIRLSGAGEEGVGEDVTYSPEAQREQQDLGPVLDRTPAPVTFVVSSRMGEPPTIAPVRRRLAVYPDLRFKLDATPDWSDELVAELVESGAVDSIDFKGAYRGTAVDTPTDPELYRRIAEAFPDAWLEDPDLDTPGAMEALEAHRDRITWDAPIHSVQDILDRRVLPRTVNLKPSRFGSVRALFGAYDFCAERGMGAYGGGQYELGPGRGQIQYLAALFHPDAPNDIAPGGYDALDPEPGLPPSPLDPDVEPIGFRRRSPSP
jgi:hypothetical protein